MARKKKMQSGCHKLTIAMAWIMAIITLAAVIAQAAISLQSF